MANGKVTVVLETKPEPTVATLEAVPRVGELVHDKGRIYIVRNVVWDTARSEPVIVLRVPPPAADSIPLGERER